MKLEIVLTPKAKETLLSTTIQIRSKWGEGSAKKFISKTYNVLDNVAEQPYLFKEYRETNVRKGIITKQTSFVYRVYDDRIEVLYFWDNRQEPAD